MPEKIITLIRPKWNFFLTKQKLKSTNPNEHFLRIQEIKQWKKAQFPPGKEYLARDRDLFLFQIYTGYYYKDLLSFTKDQLVIDEEFGYFVVGERDKNENQTMVPLFKFPYASLIIRKYQSSTSEEMVFDPSVLIEEPAYNRNLKEIAVIAGIREKCVK